MTVSSGGPYVELAGRDASRALVTFSMEALTETYDDLSDLTPHQQENLKQWEKRFTGQNSGSKMLIRANSLHLKCEK